MQLITVGDRPLNLAVKIRNRGFDLENLTDCTYGVIPTQSGAGETGCALSFGYDNALFFYGAEALAVWEMLNALHRAKEVAIAQ